MTNRGICNVGYESMKLFRRPQVYLWLASEGWEACYEVEARPIPESADIGIHLTPWKAGTLLPDYNPN